MSRPYLRPTLKLDPNETIISGLNGLAEVDPEQGIYPAFYRTPARQIIELHKGLFQLANKGRFRKGREKAPDPGLSIYIDTATLAIEEALRQPSGKGVANHLEYFHKTDFSLVGLGQVKSLAKVAKEHHPEIVTLAGAAEALANRTYPEHVSTPDNHSAAWLVIGFAARYFDFAYWQSLEVPTLTAMNDLEIRQGLGLEEL
ncbi:MAG: hypothetical protein Q7T41_02380 [Candidatus Saccharibacteria bacterium]|nr:hypothetical protein [Candidatus Saccharibacteria bacterium]